ncbi:hypothetical protein AXG93_868s1680 [Marchantia polymorpha subsp. ruderalis]|uniref:Uncharacterized protein n=1 Tax=Marchantia polymorpha subsp. ruderalis TaxID=1480154 RepID=A0A176VK48_MARPO|nr:hypothetical protein AXG93_868s1680 [Marchantia polymorpha subsp. ruderalis]
MELSTRYKKEENVARDAQRGWKRRLSFGQQEMTPWPAKAGTGFTIAERYSVRYLGCWARTVKRHNLYAQLAGRDSGCRAAAAPGRAGPGWAGLGWAVLPWLEPPGLASLPLSASDTEFAPLSKRRVRSWSTLQSAAATLGRQRAGSSSRNRKHAGRQGEGGRGGGQAGKRAGKAQQAKPNMEVGLETFPLGVVGWSSFCPPHPTPVVRDCTMFPEISSPVTLPIRSLRMPGVG